MRNRQQRRAERFGRAGAHPKTVQGRAAFGGFVAFADPASTTADGWTVLAFEVAMKGSDVTLTRKDFEDCVRNFRGYPCAPVVIEHADTDFNPFAAPPKEWREPNGHIEDLRVGTYARPVGDGATRTVATLEGKVSYLEPTATEVANKKWRFGSITIIQGAIDEETDQPIGSMLWSWSLTAHPRLKGLPTVDALAASRRLPEGATREAGWWWGDIDTREDLISCLRTIFDLPVTSTEAEVLAELDKLEGLTADGADTSGIDVDHIVGQLRDALRLPALSSPEAVIAEVRKGLTTLPSDSPDAADPSSASMSRGLVPPSTPEKSMKTFTQLAAMFGIAAASEEEALSKLQAFGLLGADALKALGLSITASAAEVAAKIDALTKAAAQVPALESELATFRAERDARTKADREGYVADVIAATPALKAVEASLRLHAERDWEGFQKSYPRPSREELAQRAQDPARSTPVTAGNNAPKDITPKGDTLLVEIRKVLAEFGMDTADYAAEAIAAGHTPESLKAALERAAR